MYSKQAILALFLAGTSANQTKIPVPHIPAEAKIIGEFVAGLLKGTIDQDDLGNITDCIKDGSSVVVGAEKMVGDFKAGGVSNIIAGVQELGVVLGEAQKTAGACIKSKQDIQKLEEMAAIFKHPIQLTVNVMKDLKLYGTTIEKEVTAGLTDYKNKKWFDMGYQFGEAAALTLEGKQAQKVIRTTRMLQGIAKPFGGHFNLEALLTCIGDEDKAALYFDEAFTDAKKAIKDKNIKEAVPALLLAFAGYKSAKTGLSSCKAIDTTTWGFDQLEQSSDILGDAQTYRVSEDQLYINESAILKDMMEAVVAYEHHDYVKAGELIGEIMKLALEGEAVETTSVEGINLEDMSSMASGFLKGTGVGEFNKADLSLCLNGSKQEEHLFEGSVKLMVDAVTHKQMKSLVDGLTGIVAFGKGMEQILPECKAITASMDWTALDAIVEAMSTPKSHMRAIGHNIVFNGKEITQNAVSCVEAWRNDDYFSFGNDLGLALKETFVKDTLF